MKQNEMTPSQLRWQKFAGFVLPVLLGWFLLSWVLGLTFWAEFIPSIASQNWLPVLSYISWFLLVPVSGLAMGALNIYCWRNQNWTDHTLGNYTLLFLIIFWVISFPLTIFLFSSCLGWIVLPLHVICFGSGQNKGKRWIETDAFNQFFGRKNDWERPDSD